MFHHYDFSAWPEASFAASHRRLCPRTPSAQRARSAGPGRKPTPEDREFVTFARSRPHQSCPPRLLLAKTHNTGQNGGIGQVDGCLTTPVRSPTVSRQTAITLTDSEASFSVVAHRAASTLSASAPYPTPSASCVVEPSLPNLPYSVRPNLRHPVHPQAYTEGEALASGNHGSPLFIRL
jgi:hypothetical protein